MPTLAPACMLGILPTLCLCLPANSAGGRWALGTVVSTAVCPVFLVRKGVQMLGFVSVHELIVKPDVHEH